MNSQDNNIPCTNKNIIILLDKQALLKKKLQIPQKDNNSNKPSQPLNQRKTKQQMN